MVASLPGSRLIQAHNNPLQATDFRYAVCRRLSLVVNDTEKFSRDNCC